MRLNRMARAKDAHEVHVLRKLHALLEEFRSVKVELSPLPVRGKPLASRGAAMPIHHGLKQMRLRNVYRVAMKSSKRQASALRLNTMRSTLIQRKGHDARTHRRFRRVESGSRCRHPVEEDESGCTDAHVARRPPFRLSFKQADPQ